MGWTNLSMMGRGYRVVDDKPIVQYAFNSYYAGEEKIALSIYK